MFDKFKQGADTLKALNKLRQIQNQLSRERVTVEENGVKVTLSGDLKVKELTIDGQEQKSASEVLNKAYEKTQKMVAQKMQEMGGGLQGLLGGLG
ncbi:MAG: YbaB/EbfC family nucleoid-associated protein [Patescibacteria group bacterium]